LAVFLKVSRGLKDAGDLIFKLSRHPGLLELDYLQMCILVVQTALSIITHLSALLGCPF